MADDKTWSEALDIAKDQMRHGKIHYADLQKVTQEIYSDLKELQCGPIIDVEVTQSRMSQQALPIAPTGKFKHEVVGGMVRCADCGKKLKSLSINHLRSHGYAAREEYMNKYNVSEKDMQGTIDRTNVRKGDDNALKILNYIMKEFDVKRAEVKPLVIKNGFTDIKDLMAKAKEKKISTVELLKEKRKKSK